MKKEHFALMRMERKRGFMAQLILAVTFLTFLIGTANAGCIGDVTGIDYVCGDTIIENCTFNDHHECTTKHGLIIGADGITIDGKGYTLSGSYEHADSEGIHNAGCNNVTVKDLTIREFNFGIYFKDASNCTIINNTITYGVGSGIWLFASSNSSITQNEIGYGEEGHGILLSDNATHNVLESNTLMTANGMGICTHDSNENEFRCNVVCGNARGDIVVESGYGNTGTNNTCNITMNYNDSAGLTCTYTCSGTSNTTTAAEPDVDVTTEKNRPRCGCRSNIDAVKIFGCGDTVTESCTFNCNLSCPEGHGLSIGADGVTIDGNSYVLDGLEPGLCGGFGIQRSGIYNPGHDHVEILDLEVKNFCNGIYLRGGEITGDFVFNNTVKNCDIHHNGNDIGETATHGIKLKYVSHSRLSNNRVHHNKGKGDSCEGGGNGIFIYGGEYNTLFDNMVYDNTKAGIFTKMKSRSNNISRNEVKGNGQGGILLRCKCSSSSNIEHNIAMDNKGPGIYVGGPDNTLRFNEVTNNRNGSAYRNDASVANGIRVSREAHNTTLIANDITDNDDVDIYAREELTVTGYNNSYQTFLNYEDDRLSVTGEEEVEGKRMVVRAETIELKKQGIELPPVKATPLIATLIVLIVLAFMVYGYSRRNT